MDSMANQQIIYDWLSCDRHSAQESLFVVSQPLIDALFQYLEHMKTDEQLLEPICSKLYSYYRSNEEQLKAFSLAFIPTLIGVHILNANNCPTGETSHTMGSIDVYLLGVYNLEVVNSEGQLVQRVFRLMSLSKPSIYHEPHSSALNQSSLLTEHNISKLDNICGDIQIPVFGPYLEFEQIVANNRMDIMTVLMKVYNQSISSLCKQSLFALCRMCLRLVRQGSLNISAEKLNSVHSNALLDCNQIFCRNSPKIALNSQLLVELTNSIYFCLFNGVTELGLEALEEIHTRAVHHLHTDVLLMTNAIRNSLLINSCQPSDGPMGINVALSPTSSTALTTTGIAKIAITNASFKTRKLPDDIPIVVTSNANTAGATNLGANHLGAINEETDEMSEKSSGKTGAIKGVKTGIGRMGVIQKLKEIKDNKKEPNVSAKNVRYRAENGDIASNKLLATHEDSGTEYGSDTSGISDTKLSLSEETIPLNVLNIQNKTYFDTNDDEVSDSSHNSCETSAKVPLVLVNTNVDSIAVNKHNNNSNETSVNV